MERRGRIHYAWFVAGATFVALLVAAAVRATPGVLIVPFEREFGWSRATISAALSLNLLLYGLTGPFCAALAERIGVRRTMALALGALGSALAVAPYIHRSWHLVLLWGVVVGVGSGLITAVIGAVIVSRWFHARRGLVMGALSASTATGQLIFLPVLARLAESAGWRAAVRTMSVAALLVVPVVLLLVRERPAALGLPPYGALSLDPAPRAAENPAVLALRTLGRAVRKPDFWALAGTFFVCGASTNGLIGTHFIPACVDHGIPEVRAASMLAAMGILDLLGTTMSGWLSDRWDSRRLLFAYYGLRGISLMVLPGALVTGQVGLLVFAVFFGLDWIATVPPTVRLATDAFGKVEGPIVFGWVLAAHQVGASFAALGAGYARTALGDYRFAFLCSGALCIAAAFLALSIRRSPAGAAPASAEPA
jgi:sugar phosphate permease